MLNIPLVLTFFVHEVIMQDFYALGQALKFFQACFCQTILRSLFRALFHLSHGEEVISEI